MKANLYPLQNRGMSRDLSVSKTENIFAWENFNVRITVREDDTMLTITNERGPKQSVGLGVSLLGWNTLGNHLVLFAKDTSWDKIYRIDYNTATDSIGSPIEIYRGDLDWDMEHPIESVVSYESEEVQKIYWVDGKNVLRSCNFMHNYGTYVGAAIDTKFDCTKGVTSAISITTSKDNGGSTRPNGTMQYFVSAYDKLGVETAIVAESSLVYLSPMDRGGAADETNNNRIIVKIAGTYNCGFDYIRLYGVLRTSQNGTPVAYIIGEQPVAGSAEGVLEIVDNGANYLSTVDASVLLFIGSKDVVPSCIAQKDNTLFLGNLAVRSNDYDLLDAWARNYVSNSGLSTVLSFSKTKLVELPSPTSSYPYKSQLVDESNISKIFKAGEKYRFAVVFKKANGDRSKAFWVGDQECTTYPDMVSVSGSAVCSIPTISISTSVAKSLGYEYAQLYMAQATYADRKVIAQGFINPTVFNLYDRYNNAPYARPSWLTRPALGNAEYMHYCSLRNSDSKQGELQSNTWEANQPKAFYGKDTTTGEITTYVPEAWASRPQNAEELEGCTAVGFIMAWDYKKTSSTFKVRRAGILIYTTTVSEEDIPADIDPYSPDSEIWEPLRTVRICTEECDWTTFVAAVHTVCEEDAVLHLYYSPTDASLNSLKNSLANRSSYDNQIPVNTSVSEVEEVVTKLESAGMFCEYSRQNYFVDDNIVTFHSPELEYEQVNVDKAESGMQLRIVGAAQISGSITDSDMQVTDSDYVGNNVIKYNYSTQNIATAVGTLTAAPMYYDSIVKDNDDDTQSIEPSKAFYMTYMWHKSGSMINYVDGSGRTYATLNTKRFANMQYAYYSHYSSNPLLYTLKGLRHITAHNSGLYEIDTVDGKKSYAVNVPATVLMPPAYKYPIYKSSKSSALYTEAMTLTSTTRASSPISITYNTRPHAVLSLDSSSSSSAVSSMTIIPKRSGSNGEDTFSLQTDFQANYIPLANKMSGGEARVYLQITQEARTGETSLYSALRGTVSIVDNGWLLVAVGISHPSGQQRTVLNSDEFTSNTITLKAQSSGGHDNWNVVGNIIALTFTTTRNGTTADGVYLYRSSSPVNVYGASSYTYLGWSDKTFSENNVQQNSITVDSFTSADSPYLLLAELVKDFSGGDTRYGGITKSAVQNNIFIPCGPEVKMTGSTAILDGTEGDTYFQRYDCVVSYPQSENDTNQSLDIASVMLETHINLDGRTDKDRGVGQLTDIDYTQFGVINPVYNQENNFIQARVFDEKFNQGDYPTTITWSREKHPLETNDTWMNVTLASTLTIDPTSGPLNALRKFRNTIIAFQDRAISEVLFNSRVQLTTTEGVPVEIAKSGKVEGSNIITNHYGSVNKWSIVEGKNGLYFKDDLSKVIAAFNGQGIEPISSKAGLNAWVRQNSHPVSWTPALFDNTLAFYDNIHSDVYFVGASVLPDGTANPHPCLVYSEVLGNFTGFFSYAGTPLMTNLGSKYISYWGSHFWYMNEGVYNKFFDLYKPSYVIWRVTPDAYTDKIWSNLEYRADFMTMLDSSGNNLYKEGESPTGAGNLADYNPDVTFDTVRVWNEYQDTGNINMVWAGPGSQEDLNSPDIRKKFRIWRADIPRDSYDPNGIDRIRNPWIWLKVQKTFSATDGLDKMRFQLHDMVVKYFTTD